MLGLKTAKVRSRALASTAIVLTTGLVITTLAVLYEGYTKADLDLSDGGVWVTQNAQALVGHLNHPSQVLDSFLDAESADLDLLQDGDGVLAYDATMGITGQIDPTTSTYLGKGHLNPGSVLAFRANTVAMIDPGNRGLYVTTLTGSRGLSAENQDPLATLGEGSDVTVGVEGTVYAISRSGDLYTVPGVGVDPVVTHLADFGEDAKLDITVVGDLPVVLDATSGTFYLQDRQFTVPAAIGGLLQQAGPANDRVVVASTSALLVQPLDGSAAEPLEPALAGQGDPSEPVWLAGCAYGVWSKTGVYARDCSGTENDRNEVLDGIKGMPSLKLRQNRNVVVVNDTVTGDAWLVDADEAVLVDNWNQITPDSDPEEQQEESQEEAPQFKLPDRSGANQPPTAKPDTYGTRARAAGSTMILPVLENDTDPDGDLLSARVPNRPDFVDAIDPVTGGGALQIRLLPQATSPITFDYIASDGRGGEATGRVTLTIVPDSENRKPRQKEKVQQLTVELKAGVTYNVLNDWQDPDGDDIYLVSATSEGGKDDVSFRSNGVIQFRENVGETGVRKVNLLISDGRETAEGTLEVNVRPKNVLQPVANSDRVAATVDLPVTVNPLANDLSPSGRPLSLSSAKPADCPGATATVNPEAGTLVFTSSQPGTCYVQYLVTDGPGGSDGLIRVDVTQAEADLKEPVAARDVALLPDGGEVLVDVLGNDTDPSGGLLVLQSVELNGAGDRISAEVLDHQTLRVKQTGTLDSPITLYYWVASGNLASRGEVQVMPVPLPEKPQAPVAIEDRAIVRAGDVVTIDVLANDYHPDGGRIFLLPELAEKPPASDGEAFIAGDRLRFQAGPEAKTVQASYTITDENGQFEVTRLVSIQITKPNPESNSAPRPLPVTARVLDGTSVRIPIPLDGIDPEGDSVELIGTTTAPEKGRVLVGDAWLIYEAYPKSTGVDSFTYQVRDRLGDRATGTVTVGIAGPSAQNQPPYTTDDEVQVRPGRKVSVPVLSNDSDPDGDEVLLSSKLKTSGIEAKVEGGRVLVTAPQTEGDHTVTYKAVDPYDASQDGILRVKVDAKAPLKPPVARDDRVQPALVGGMAVEVPVLDNDDDPDGVVDKLEVSTSDPTASVTADKKLRIELLPQPQVILYTVTDQDRQSAKAFAFVPGIDSLLPSLRLDMKPIEVVAGQTAEIALADHVVVRAEREPRIADGKVDAYWAEPVAIDERTISYTADENHYGPDAVTVLVTDGVDGDDPEGNKAYVSLPIQVLPATNQPPTLQQSVVEVEAGNPEPATLNLRRLSSDPNPGDLEKLTYKVTKESPGIHAEVSGFELRVTAEASAVSGTLTVQVSDGTSESGSGEVTVNVSGSLERLPSVTNDRYPKADQGVAVDYPVLVNDDNPFKDQGKPLTIVDAKRVSGKGHVEPTPDRQQLRITPDADFVGDLVISYTIQDATGLPERQAEGTATVTVQGRPDQPAKPVLVSVGDQHAILEWKPPAANGRRITGYEVTSVSGPKFAKECGSTTCTLDGLQNAKEYTFTVVAVNEIGPSDASPASAVAFPDVIPDTPGAPTVVFGDASLTLNWVKPKSRGSAITGYNLSIEPTPAGYASIIPELTGTSYVWRNLQNGTPYRVRVQAVNLAGESGWSDYSPWVTPAREPDPPGKPTTTPGDPVGSQRQLRVSWDAPADDGGDAVKRYTLTTRRGGSVVGTKEVTGTSTTVNVDVGTTPYTFTVVAHNKAGASESSPVSEPRQAANPPDPVSNLRVTPGDKELRVSFAAGGLGGSGSDQVTFEYRLNPSGRTGTLPAGGGTIGNLTNGTAYTVSVRVASRVDGVEASAWRAADPETPFGRPFAPTVSARPDGQRVVFNWSPPAANGRAIDRLEISLNGGTSWEPVGRNSGSRTVGSGYSQTHSIRVRAIDSVGQESPEASASARTVEPPQPRAWLSNLNGKSVTLNVENWTAERRTVRCWAAASWDTRRWPPQEGHNFAGEPGSYDIPATGTVRITCNDPNGVMTSGKPFSIELLGLTWVGSITIP